LSLQEEVGHAAHIVMSLMSKTVKLFKAALYSKVTIVMFVVVQDVATSYTTSYTIVNMPALNYKTQSTYLIRISQHFMLLSCPALASEGCRYMWKLCTGFKSCISCSRYITILY